ncbi:MAG: hypothetical protein IPM03_12580 [Sulfuritalea sp.]|nr:hypothetical protein [Sulfuritalea sp.]
MLVINRYRFLHSYKPAYGRLLLLASVFSVTACGSVPSTHVVFPTHGESVTAEAPIAPSLAASTQASPPVSTTTLSNGDVKHEAATTPSAEVLQHRHEPRPISPKAKNPLPEIAPHVTITKSGSAVYYIPKQMVANEASHVDLWIDRTTTVAQLKQELAIKLQITADKIHMRRVHHTEMEAGTPVMAQLDGATIPIGGSMIAQLRGGDDFAIEPKDPVQQPLQDVDRAMWNWRVTPRRVSNDGLLLDLDIWIDPGPGKRLIDSYHESVIVKTAPRPWWKIVYEWLQEFDALLKLVGISGVGGLLVLLYKRWKPSVASNQTGPKLIVPGDASR